MLNFEMTLFKTIIVMSVLITLNIFILTNDTFNVKRSADFIIREISSIQQKNNVNDNNTVKEFESIIVRPKYDIKCESILEMDSNEVEKSNRLLKYLKTIGKNYKVNMINDENYIFNTSMCDSYKSIRGFEQVDKYNEQFEKEFPLAFAILTYQHAEQIDRLLKLIWRPQNYYCIHIDSKSTDSFKKAIHSIANCFDNVFITKKSENMVWAGFSILKAELNCMEDLDTSDKKWKYLIHMSGNEFPLKTNYELVKILKMYNGANEIEIVNGSSVTYRIQYKHKVNSQNKLEKTNLKLDKPPHNFTINKGYTNAVLSREFANFVLTDRRVQDLIDWAKDMTVPDEMLWATVQTNTQFNPPGGYKLYKPNDRLIKETFARFSGWHGTYDCKGSWRNNICMLSIEDLPYLITLNHFIANKFLLDSEPIAYQCLEEWYEYKRIYKPVVNMYGYCQLITKHSTITNCPQ